MKIYLLLSAVIALASAQSKGGYAPPVAILKQIDKHNDDGSYSYGYENGDGTYKIETKYPTGEVFGKYGYIDDRGQLREVEYGASKRGFEPSGVDVTVAPPTLNQNPVAPLGPDDEDDGQYREDPAIYYNKDPNYVPTAPAENTYRQSSYEMNYTPSVYGSPRPTYTQAYTPQTRPATYTAPAYNPPQQPATYTAPAYNPPQQPAYTPPYTPPAPAYNPPQYNDYYNNRVNNPAPQPQFNYAPQKPYWNPTPSSYAGYNPNQFAGHPAQNVDILTGSYTVNYRR